MKDCFPCHSCAVPILLFGTIAAPRSSFRRFFRFSNHKSHAVEICCTPRLSQTHNNLHSPRRRSPKTSEPVEFEGFYVRTETRPPGVAPDDLQIPNHLFGLGTTSHTVAPLWRDRPQPADFWLADGSSSAARDRHHYGGRFNWFSRFPPRPQSL